MTPIDFNTLPRIADFCALASENTPCRYVDIHEHDHGARSDFHVVFKTPESAKLIAIHGHLEDALSHAANIVARVLQGKGDEEGLVNSDD